MKTILAILASVIVLASCHREHKVHNIVLYPDKQSWCKTTPIKQVVGEPGYDSRTVENSVCVGTCFSYSIPHTSDITITPYCDSCQPSETHWFHVTLHKLANADEELSEYPNQDFSTPLPDTIQKQIQIITNCTCLSCNEQLNSHKYFNTDNTTELPNSLLASDKKTSDNRRDYDSNIWDTDDQFSPEDVPQALSALMVHHEENKQGTDLGTSIVPPFEIPELLQLVNRTNRSKSGRINMDLFDKGKVFDFQNVSAEQKYFLNTKLISLLKNIQNSSRNDTVPAENNFNFDRELLSELLDIIEGSEDHLNDKNLMEFVNFVNVHNSEDFELDLSRLKAVLTKYENEKSIELKGMDGGFGIPITDEESSIEYSNVKGGGNDASHINVEHLTSSQFSSKGSDPNVITAKHSGYKKLHEKHHGRDGLEKHQHFSGEHINLDVSSEDEDSTDKNRIIKQLGGHLVHGPHGSLIIQPDQVVEEKLNMQPHLLRPNHEGTVIHYESHVRDKHKVMEN